ncbi:MAG: tRNA (adenosine(37)-N6)-threonylcarbamoyltransferase complex ATPase subunit type 1 TsaE [Acidobacteriota bacterium]
MELFLPDERATLALGRALALSLPEEWEAPAALLRAELGSGKTTLARGFVAALPGSEQAEVASPSFNLANIYPTRPQVLHLDLYRLGEGLTDGGLEELLEAGPAGAGHVLLVEWAQYMPEASLPDDWLSIRLSEEGDGRRAVLEAHGPNAALWLERTTRTYLKSDMS